MPATHDVFERFVQTGELEVPKPKPYYTYQVGIDESIHPDRDIAMRFVEFMMSDCKYGCKIYADPFSKVRVLWHAEVYGCRMTRAKIDAELDRVN